MSKLYAFRLMFAIGTALLIYGACVFESNDASISAFVSRFVIGVILCAPCYMSEITRYENRSK